MEVNKIKQFLSSYSTKFNNTFGGVNLASCICFVESSGNKNARRYEPGFEERYIVPLKLTDKVEIRFRSTSWGLFQIMGQKIRELGVMSPSNVKMPISAVEFCQDVSIQIDTFNRIIENLCKRYNGDMDLVISAYNAGTAKKEVLGNVKLFKNQGYVNRVNQAGKELGGLFPLIHVSKTENIINTPGTIEILSPTVKMTNIDENPDVTKEDFDKITNKEPKKINLTEKPKKLREKLKKIFKS